MRLFYSLLMALASPMSACSWLLNGFASQRKIHRHHGLRYFSDQFVFFESMTMIFASSRRQLKKVFNRFHDNRMIRIITGLCVASAMLLWKSSSAFISAFAPIDDFFHGLRLLLSWRYHCCRLSGRQGGLRLAPCLAPRIISETEVGSGNKIQAEGILCNTRHLRYICAFSSAYLDDPCEMRILTAPLWWGETEKRLQSSSSLGSFSPGFSFSSRMSSYYEAATS